ncbi:MAG: prenyltransferase [Agarilytica sp.]
MTSTLDKDPQLILHHVHRYILSCQRADGAILWFEDGKLDPWDHTEAAMGLSINGDFKGFRHAFDWLINIQNSDGSWFAKYYGALTDEDLDRAKIETNFVAYPACGLWHYFLISQDIDYVQRAFPYIEKAINFVLSHQSEEGDIQWACSSQETLPKDALITACASILRSLECAIMLAERLDIPHTWTPHYIKLADTLKNKPWRFDRTWEPKTRFSMDWFYPILSGIYSKEEAQQRLNVRWDEFVHPEYGCRCVNDEPWVTIAESCELTLALIASGQQSKAHKLFNQLLRWQDEDGGFWTGYTYRDKVIWPKEKTTWTAAATLLALDALENITPASTLFTTESGLTHL